MRSVGRNRSELWLRETNTSWVSRARHPVTIPASYWPPGVTWPASRPLIGCRPQAAAQHLGTGSCDDVPKGDHWAGWPGQGSHPDFPPAPHWSVSHSPGLWLVSSVTRARDITADPNEALWLVATHLTNHHGLSRTKVDVIIKKRVSVWNWLSFFWYGVFSVQSVSNLL